MHGYEHVCVECFENLCNLLSKNVEEEGHHGQERAEDGDDPDKINEIKEANDMLSNRTVLILELQAGVEVGLRELLWSQVRRG